MKANQPSFWSLILGLALLAASGVACAGAMPAESPNPASAAPTQAAISPPEEATQAAAYPTQAALPTAAVPSPQPVILENRLLTIEWPPSIRAGDTDFVRLTLEMDAQGQLTPTVQQAGNQLQSQPVQIPNVYDTHNVLVEARLDLAGAALAPAGEIAEPLRPGKKVAFVWSVRLEQVGRYRGSIWVHLHFVPLPGVNPATDTREVLSNQMIEIQGVNLLGLGGSTARVAGGVGTVLGSILSLDSIVTWVVKLVKGRKRKGPVQNP